MGRDTGGHGGTRGGKKHQLYCVSGSSALGGSDLVRKLAAPPTRRTVIFER